MSVAPSTRHLEHDDNAGELSGRLGGPAAGRQAERPSRTDWLEHRANAAGLPNECHIQLPLCPHPGALTECEQDDQYVQQHGHAERLTPAHIGASIRQPPTNQYRVAELVQGVRGWYQGQAYSVRMQRQPVGFVGDAVQQS